MQQIDHLGRLRRPGGVGKIRDHGNFAGAAHLGQDIQSRIHADALRLHLFSETTIHEGGTVSLLDFDELAATIVAPFGMVEMDDPGTVTQNLCVQLVDVGDPELLGIVPVTPSASLLDVREFIESTMVGELRGRDFMFVVCGGVHSAPQKHVA